MDVDSDLLENIIACRTCGIHYVTPSKYQLKHLFQSPLENSELMLIRLELAQWNVEVSENDGFPQHVCNACIHKFEKVFELRAACVNAQNEFRKFYVPNGSLANIKIKSELPDQDEEQPICDFIYVDDLSDTEYDGAAPFHIPHVPIKEEIIEAATIPMEESQQPTSVVESASKIAMQTATSSHIPKLRPQNESEAISSQSAVFPQMPIEPIECKLCQHLSFSQEDHKQHMQRAHEIRDLDCHICGKVFKNSTPARLKFHMKWHTLNKHVKCAQCGFVCNSKDALREHKRANHGKINCKICGKGVLAKKMKSHLRQHEQLSQYSCEYCKESFSTEHERENHIWQIHANEENIINTTQNTIPIVQSSTTQIPTQENGENLFCGQQEEELLRQEPEDETLNYKFLCAHCDQRFMQQFQLETHVNEEHRSKILHRKQEAIENSQIHQATEVMEDESGHDNAHSNITVFEDYDNDTDELLVNNASTINAQVIATSTQFVNQSELMENEDNIEQEHSEVTTDYNNETASISSLTEDEENEDGENDDTESEDETNSNLPASYEEDIHKTFACAKCSETFVTIEQLRQHHEQHLLAKQEQQANPPKCLFKCNLCGKSFNLKFSLNRHVKKHKNSPI